jgi:hypothetical protein
MLKEAEEQHEQFRKKKTLRRISSRASSLIQRGHADGRCNTSSPPIGIVLEVTIMFADIVIMQLEFHEPTGLYSPSTPIRRDCPAPRMSQGGDIASR